MSGLVIFPPGAFAGPQRELTDDEVGIPAAVPVAPQRMGAGPRELSDDEVGIPSASPVTGAPGTPLVSDRIAADNENRSWFDRHIADPFIGGVADLQGTGAVLGFGMNRAVEAGARAVPENPISWAFRKLLGGERPQMDSRASELADTQRIQNALAFQASVPRSPGLEYLTQNEGFTDTLKRIGDLGLSNTVGMIPEVTVRSLVGQAPALAASMFPATLAGRAATVGAGSAINTFAGELPSNLKDQGTDLRDTEAFRADLMDPEKVGPAALQAAQKAAVVGALDAASGAIAGKMLAPGFKGSPRLGEVANVAIAQPIAQGALGGAGEALGSVAAGKPVNWGEVFLEALGEAGGAPVEVATVGKNALMERVRGWAAARDLDPATMTVGDVAAAAQNGDQEARAALKAMGISDEALASYTPGERGLGGLLNEVMRRRERDALMGRERPAVGDDLTPAEIKRRRDERLAVQAGDIDPAAASTAGREAPSLPDVFTVDPAGRVGDPNDVGAVEGMRQTRTGRGLVPVYDPANPQPSRMTPEEIEAAQSELPGGRRAEAARQAAQARAGGATDLGGITVPEGRAPQLPEQAETDRRAGEAFALAQRQRERVAADAKVLANEPADSQAAGRAEGFYDQQVFLDDGFPVQVLKRETKEINGRMVDVAIVQRFDPKTGIAEPGSVQYAVPMRELRTANFTPQPRQAQDFRDRARSPIISEGRARGQRADEALGLPEQTYRTTAPDPAVPGTEGPASETPPRGPVTRAARPDQPEGPMPGRDQPRRERAQRAQNEEEIFRRYEEGRAGRENRQQEAPQDDGAKKPGTSNTAKKEQKDGTYEVDGEKYVVSDKGGPIVFSNQKQAAAWVLKVGNKSSGGQVFDIANHPYRAGKFTVIETGRVEPDPSPPPKGDIRNLTSDLRDEKVKPNVADVAEYYGMSEARALEALTEDAKKNESVIDAAAYDPATGRPIRFRRRTEGRARKARADAIRHAYDLGLKIEDFENEEVFWDRYYEAAAIAAENEEQSEPELSLETQSARDAMSDEFDAAMPSPIRDPASETNSSQSEPASAENEVSFNSIADTMFTGAIFDPRVLKIIGQSLRQMLRGTTALVQRGARAVGIDLENYVKDYINALKEAETGFLDKSRDLALKAKDIFTIGLRSNDAFLRSLAARHNSPAIAEIADLFSRVGGRIGQTVREGLSYQQAIDQRLTARLNLYEKITSVLDKMPRGQRDAILKQAGRLLQTRGFSQSSNEPAHVVARQLAKMLKEELAFMREAGIEVGEIKYGFLPTLLSAPKVLANRKQFLDDATRAYVLNGMQPQQARVAAEAWLQNILLGDDGVRVEGSDFVSIGRGPGGSRAIEGREFNQQARKFLEGKGWYETSLDQIIPNYLASITRRAEWVRRMGKDGEKWQALKERVIAEGAAEALPEIVETIQSSAGMMGAGSKLRRLSAGMRTWFALASLSRATYTSLSEMLLPGIRQGSAAGMFRGVGETVAFWTNLYKAPMVRNTEWAQRRAAAVEFARDMGMISSGLDNILLSQRFDGGGQLSGKITNQFFKVTLLHSFTNATRMASLMMGDVFVRRMIADHKSGSHFYGINVGGAKIGVSAKVDLTPKLFLGEIGIPENKIDALAKWLDGVAPADPSILTSKDPMARMYLDALTRFNQQSVMSPTNADRPRYAAHPLGALVYQLTGYLYAFQRNVLNRNAKLFAQGAVEFGKNLVPGVKSKATIADSLSMMAPVAFMPMIFAMQAGLEELREKIWDDGTSKPAKPEDWTKALKIASRSGFFGIADPAVNLMNAVRYDRSPVEVASGPAISTVTRIAKTWIDFLRVSDLPNDDRERQYAKRQAAKETYNGLINPAAAMLMTTLGGPTGSVLAGVGTQAAAHPRVRELFVSSVAGPKPKKKTDPFDFGSFGDRRGSGEYRTIRVERRKPDPFSFGADFD